MMQITTCRLSPKEAHGVKVKLLFTTLIVCLSLHYQASATENKQLEEDYCAHGSHKELYQFFTQQNYAVIAQGKRIQPNGNIKDFADVLFLLSPDMAYFHAVTLNGIKYDYFKACIYSSAREIDFQFASPIPDLLERKNREHLVFLVKDIPKDNICPSHNPACIPWSEWSKLLKQTFIFSAYAYSSQSAYDPYNEIVEITIDSKTIAPTRGVLAEHARVKYALRLRNELQESIDDLNAAKEAYIHIHNEVDHKLPLMFLSADKNRGWTITQVNRESGLAEKILHGIDLELYPMNQADYKKLLQK